MLGAVLPFRGVCLPTIEQQELPPALGRTGKSGVVAQTLPVPDEKKESS